MTNTPDPSVTERELVRRLVLPMVEERSREPGDAWDQAAKALAAITSMPKPALEEENARLREALGPFAETWREAQPYADFDGQDCRENYIGGSVNLADWERAAAALSPRKEDQ